MDAKDFDQFWEKTPKSSVYYQAKDDVKAIWDSLKPEAQEDYISFCVENEDMLTKENGDIFSALARMMLRLEY